MSQDTLLTVSQAAEALNVKVGTIRNWILHRKLAYTKLLGGAVRIPQSECQRVIAEGTVPAR
jgi:excisionase family DNA binding protein